MEWFTTNDGKYRVESLSPATFPGALEVMRTAFFQDEAVAIGTEVNKNRIAAEELLELCAYTALDGVSLVAVSIQTGEVVAATFNKILIKTSDSEKSFFEIFSKRFTQASSRSVAQFNIEIDRKCNLFEKYGVDCSFEIMFLATLREHRNRNLGFLLCKISVDLAKKLKYGPIFIINVADLGTKYSHLSLLRHIQRFVKQYGRRKELEELAKL